MTPTFPKINFSQIKASLADWVETHVKNAGPHKDLEIDVEPYPGTWPSTYHGCQSLSMEILRDFTHCSVPTCGIAISWSPLKGTEKIMFDEWS